MDLCICMKIQVSIYKTKDIWLFIDLIILWHIILRISSNSNLEELKFMQFGSLISKFFKFIIYFQTPKSFFFFLGMRLWAITYQVSLPPWDGNNIIRKVNYRSKGIGLVTVLKTFYFEEKKKTIFFDGFVYFR